MRGGGERRREVALPPSRARRAGSGSPGVRAGGRADACRAVRRADHGGADRGRGGEPVGAGRHRPSWGPDRGGREPLGPAGGAHDRCGGSRGQPRLHRHDGPVERRPHHGSPERREQAPAGDHDLPLRRGRVGRAPERRHAAMGAGGERRGTALADVCGVLRARGAHRDPDQRRPRCGAHTGAARGPGRRGRTADARATRGDEGARPAGDGGRCRRDLDLSHLSARRIRDDGGTRRTHARRGRVRRHLLHAHAERVAFRPGGDQGGDRDRRPRRHPRPHLPPQGGGTGELAADGRGPRPHRLGARRRDRRDGGHLSLHPERDRSRVLPPSASLRGRQGALPRDAVRPRGTGRTPPRSGDDVGLGELVPPCGDGLGQGPHRLRPR